MKQWVQKETGRQRYAADKSTGLKGVGTGGPMDKTKAHRQTDTPDTQTQRHGPSRKQGTDESMTKTGRQMEREGVEEAQKGDLERKTHQRPASQAKENTVGKTGCNADH